MSDFSCNLKRWRKKAGLSQDELSEKLCVTRQTISSWERGNSYPSIESLTQISDALDVSPNALLYPPEKTAVGRGGMEISPHGFRTIAILIFVVGLLCGTRAGSQAYSPLPNTVAWQFVFSDAFRYWVPAALWGMAFLAFEQIASSLHRLLTGDA